MFQGCVMLITSAVTDAPLLRALFSMFYDNECIAKENEAAEVALKCDRSADRSIKTQSL